MSSPISTRCSTGRWSWGERRKAAAAEQAAPIAGNGSGGSDGCGYSVEQIEQIVRAGAPAGEDRSDLFHTIVGHILGCGWDAEQIAAHLQQFPTALAAATSRRIGCTSEIARSAGKFKGAELPLFDAMAGPERLGGKGAAAAEGSAGVEESEPKEPLPEHEQDEPDKPQWSRSKAG